MRRVGAAVKQLAGECRAPEKGDEDENGDGTDDNEHDVLAEAAGLHRSQAEARGVRPACYKVEQAIDERAIGDKVPAFGKLHGQARETIEETVDPALVDCRDHS